MSYRNSCLFHHHFLFLTFLFSLSSLSFFSEIVFPGYCVAAAHLFGFLVFSFFVYFPSLFFPLALTIRNTKTTRIAFFLVLFRFFLIAFFFHEAVALESITQMKSERTKGYPM